MHSLAVILVVLSWEAELQLRCFPGLASDSGSLEFGFDLDNPIVKLARVIDDLHFQREGETLAEWRERQGVKQLLEKETLENLDAVLEGLQVVFDLMRRSSKHSLFTAHGLRKAAAWRLIRRLASEGKKHLHAVEAPTPAAVAYFLKNYDLVEQ